MLGTLGESGIENILATLRRWIGIVPDLAASGR
jgi:hypothetical protein